MHDDYQRQDLVSPTKIFLGIAVVQDLPGRVISATIRHSAVCVCIPLVTSITRIKASIMDAPPITVRRRDAWPGQSTRVNWIVSKVLNLEKNKNNPTIIDTKTPYGVICLNVSTFRPKYRQVLQCLGRFLVLNIVLSKANYVYFIHKHNWYSLTRCTQILQLAGLYYLTKPLLSSSALHCLFVVFDHCLCSFVNS